MLFRIGSLMRRNNNRPAHVRNTVANHSIVSCIALTFLAGCASRPDSNPTVDTSNPTMIELSTASDIAPPALTRGWIDFLTGLRDARRAIEDPALFPPAPTDRNLAEGYRYLLGHLARIIEAETQGHPDFPYFQRYVRMLSKWTIDNPDAIYLSSPIDADGVYRIRGRALDASEWRTSKRGRSVRRAPRVLIFQTTTASIGETGRLAEMRECRNQTLDSIDQFDLELDRNGRFEILVSGKKPADYDGPFLSSRTELPCVTPFGTMTYRSRGAPRTKVREIFTEGDDVVPLELEIVRFETRGAPRPPRTSAEMGLSLGEIGRKLANQIEFWNLFHEFALEVKGDRDGDGRMALPLNDMNQPSPPFVAGGTAGSGQLYAAGIFELDPDEALVVRVEAPIEPHYVGFQLGNLWGESLDQANFVSSATGAQNPVASDGARYYVVSARDPGTPGWINTTGLSKVTMSMRFIFRENPPRSDMPTIKTYATKLANVREHLPADTRQVSPDERRREVDGRQRHIQRRWRQY